METPSTPRYVVRLPGSQPKSLGCAYVLALTPEQVARGEEQERTTSKKALFLERLEQMRGLVSPVCEAAGIHRSTYYEWIKNDPEFESKVKEIQRAKPDMAYDRLYVKAMEGHVGALKYIVSHIHPEFMPKPKGTPASERTFEDILYDQALRNKEIAEAELQKRNRRERDDLNGRYPDAPPGVI